MDPARIPLQLPLMLDSATRHVLSVPRAIEPELIELLARLLLEAALAPGRTPAGGIGESEDHS